MHRTQKPPRPWNTIANADKIICCVGIAMGILPWIALGFLYVIAVGFLMVASFYAIYDYNWWPPTYWEDLEKALMGD